MMNAVRRVSIPTIYSYCLSVQPCSLLRIECKVFLEWTDYRCYKFVSIIQAKIKAFILDFINAQLQPCISHYSICGESIQQGTTSKIRDFPFTSELKMYPPRLETCSSKQPAFTYYTTSALNRGWLVCLASAKCIERTLKSLWTTWLMRTFNSLQTVVS